jgi:outer membrane protein assembly factor BamB
VNPRFLILVLLLTGCLTPADDLNAGLGAAFDSDGGLVLIGAEKSDAVGDLWVGRIDRDGTPRWQTTFGTGDPERITDVLAADGSTVLSGSVRDSDACDGAGAHRGFLAEFDDEGALTRARLARPGGEGRCEERSLTIGQVARAGDRLVALGRTESDAVTVFVAAADEVTGAQAFDGELESTRLLGHRDGFVVAGRRPGERGEEPGVELTAFSFDGEVLWSRGAEAGAEDAPSVVAAGIVDGNVVVVLQRLGRSKGNANILRYDFETGALLWSTALEGSGTPFAIVDGPRRQWALVRRRTWDFEIVNWRRDQPNIAVAYTAEGVVNLAYRYGESGVEIVDRDAPNDLRWWNPIVGDECDRSAGLVGVPAMAEPTLGLERREHSWVPAEIELTEWVPATRNRSGDVPLETCIDGSYWSP